MNDTTINYLDIRWVLFEGKNHQISGWHPAVITQNNIGNKYSSNVQAIPISSSMTKAKMPTHVYLPSSIGLNKDSIAQCESMMLVDKSNVGRYIASLPREYSKQITKAVNINNPLLSGLTKDELLSLWADVCQFSGRVA